MHLGRFISIFGKKCDEDSGGKKRRGIEVPVDPLHPVEEWGGTEDEYFYRQVSGWKDVIADNHMVYFEDTRPTSENKTGIRKKETSGNAAGSWKGEKEKVAVLTHHIKIPGKKVLCFDYSIVISKTRFQFRRNKLWKWTKFSIENVFFNLIIATVKWRQPLKKSKRPPQFHIGDSSTFQTEPRGGFEKKRIITFICLYRT